MMITNKTAFGIPVLAAGTISVCAIASAAAVAAVTIGEDGKLSGGMTGYAWVAGGNGTTFTSPASCNNDGCFKNTEGKLCAAGSIAALSCTESATSFSCNWKENWGATIGMHANQSKKSWGERAPSTLALDFHGAPGKYRLAAHVAGDPDTKQYCLDQYLSGQVVDAQTLRAACWAPNGAPLPSFEQVDYVQLQVLSENEKVPINYCITAIHLSR